MGTVHKLMDYRKMEPLTPAEKASLRETCEIWKKAGLDFPRTLQFFPTGHLPELLQIKYAQLREEAKLWQK